jgi:predicted enzyme related to lactoylglutathione lyase
VNHTIVHFEIPAEDPETLNKFYNELFDWNVVKMPMGDGMDYYVLQTVPTDDQGMVKEPGVNGGLMKRMAPDQRPINYIGVESVADYVTKAKKLGATILMDKSPVPGMGWFAQLVDPQGNPFAIFEMDASSK